MSVNHSFETDAGIVRLAIQRSFLINYQNRVKQRIDIVFNIRAILTSINLQEIV